MAPLPPSSTARLFVDYVTAGTLGVEHTFQVRYASGDRSAADAQARVLSFLQGVGAAQFVTGWRVLRVRTALAGEDFTGVQVPIAGLAAFIGTNAGGYTRDRQTEEWTWQGRGVASPRRVDVSLYGIRGDISQTLRWQVGGSSPAWIGTSCAALQAASSPLVCIDGAPIIWYSYVNQNRNSYWERRIRVS